MRNDFDGCRKLAYAIFARVWEDALGNCLPEEEQNTKAVELRKIRSRRWLLGYTKRDRDAQEFWSQFFLDDSVLRRTREKARKKWPNPEDIEIPKTVLGKTIKIPDGLPVIESSLHKYCMKYGVPYRRVYYLKRAYEFSNEQAAYYVLKEKEKENGKV